MKISIKWSILAVSMFLGLAACTSNSPPTITCLPYIADGKTGSLFPPGFAKVTPVPTYDALLPDLSIGPATINGAIVWNVPWLQTFVYNRGNAPAGPSVVAFWDGEPGQGGKLIGEVDVPPLDNDYDNDEYDNVYEVEIAWPVEESAGLRTIYTVVDAHDDVEEFYEMNNMRCAQIIVPKFVLKTTVDTSITYDRNALIPIDIEVINLQPDVDLSLTVVTSIMHEQGAYVYENEQSVYVPAGERLTIKDSWQANEALGGFYVIYVGGGLVGMFGFGYDERIAARQEIFKIEDSANFVGSPLSGTLPLTITFTDRSTPRPPARCFGCKRIMKQEWNFGDGSPIVTQTNSIHVYDRPGIYTVTLTTTVALSGTVKSSSTRQYVENKSSYITVR